jgi:hypothetical protein
VNTFASRWWGGWAKVVRVAERSTANAITVFVMRKRLLYKDYLAVLDS